VHVFVTLVRQFDFPLLDNGQELRVVRLGLIRPVVVGEEHKGQQILLGLPFLGASSVPWCSPDSCARGERVAGMTKTLSSCVVSCQLIAADQRLTGLA
jgi:hypothetical protein